MVPPDHVMFISILLTIEASTVATVPPNGIVTPVPAVAMVPCPQKHPVPIQVEFTPGAPMVRKTISNARYHGTTDVIGMVWAGLAPKAVDPKNGVIMSELVAALCEIVPPAR